MGLSGGLLKLHGLVEILAGVAMIVATDQVFPFLGHQSLEVQYVAKCFGAAIISLGLTALLSFPSRGIIFGALSYHSSVTALFIHQISENISSDPAATKLAAIFHGAFTLLFALAWLTYASPKVKKN